MAALVVVRGSSAPGLPLPRPGSRESCGFVVLGLLARSGHKAARRRHYCIFLGMSSSASCLASQMVGGETARGQAVHRVTEGLTPHLDQPLLGRQRLRKGRRLA